MRIGRKQSRATRIAASISGLSFITTVSAQEAEELVEEVVVTGFRASLATALETKRESSQIIESVAAEDIGKFPDQNVAEALQRLSGVQIDRSNGQGTQVRIRGLEQNVTLLNNDIFLTGLELYTQGEGNFRESDSLEGIPSELLGGVDVYKSQNASQLGVWNRDYGQLDAQVGYQVTDNIGVTIEAINLTEEDQSQYLQFENLPFAFESSSRRVLLGVRGSFGEGASR